VNYPHTEGYVINAVDSALASCDRDTMLSLATDLDRDNNLGCPLGETLGGCCSGYLGGACFNITPNPYAASPATLTVCDNQANDSNSTAGVILLANVPCGNYTITEHSAPSGYVIVTGSQNVTVTDNQTETVEFTNTRTPCTGEIEIYKEDEETGELLGGACFNITPDPTSADLTGTLEVCDNDANDADATNGTIRVENVTCGNYTITESSAPPGYVIVTGSQNVTVTGNQTETVEFSNTRISRAAIEVVKTAALYGEGCTPGYWKNHVEDWPEVYNASQNVSSVFNVSSCEAIEELAGDTLLEALEYPGGDDTVGAARILLRAAVAAVLNAAHSDVNYPRTVGEVIDAVNHALASCNRDTMLPLATQLDRDNNEGCPLDGGSCDSCCSGTDPLRVSIGDTVVYCYRVTNVGDVALYNITLVADMGTFDTGDDVLVSLGATTLAPGESTNGTLEYVVVAGDAPRRTNIATATGAPEVGENVTDTDDCTIILLSLSPTAQLR
jgi:hypothetical protein